MDRIQYEVVWDAKEGWSIRNATLGHIVEGGFYTKKDAATWILLWYK
jgi:hypothetical protein